MSSESQSETGVRQVPVIGILGGVGSGKSSVVRHVDGWRLPVIDADKIGHDLLGDSEIQSDILKQFGREVFSAPTTVSRSQLARRVFGESSQQKEALKQLNSILHPAIRREIYSQIQRHTNPASNADVVILDAALLLEGGWDEVCDWLIYIDTPESIRRQRVQENRGWTAEELRRREAAQLSTDIKKDQADFVVDNSGAIDKAADQMKQILTSILSE